ncbi:hypothetical protein, partial [Parabacteroides leei]
MKVFDAEKFRVKMESLLGGQYVSRLVEITGTNRTTVRRWVVKSPDNPQKGPSPKFQDIISKKIKEEFGISIMWREFMNPLIDEEEQKLDDSIFKPDAFDPYEELLIA